MTPIQLFIVDDHPIVLKGLSHLLATQSDIEVRGVALNGKVLLDFLSKEKEPIDVLLLDLNMPEMSHVDLLKQILVHYPKIKVIVFSMYLQPELVREVVGMGVSGYLHKTSAEKEIVEAIKRVYNGESFFGNSVRIGGNSLEISNVEDSSDAFIKEINLSPRERDVLVLIAKGMTNQGVAECLFISKHTVETHRKNIMRKLSFNSTAEMIQFAVKQGMV